MLRVLKKFQISFWASFFQLPNDARNVLKLFFMNKKQVRKIPDLIFFFKPSLSLCSAVNSFMQFAEGFSQANMSDKPALKT